MPKRKSSLIKPNVVRRPCCGAIVPVSLVEQGAVRVRHKGGCRG